MNWLLSTPLRPLVLMAGLASLLLNLALVVPSLYMLQVFDRVFASRSVETLVMLGLVTLLALGLGFVMDRARSLLLARAGRTVDEALSATALAAGLEAAAQGRCSGERAALPDIARLRQFLSSPAVHALFDAPWLPVYLLVIFSLHPVLGWTAAASAAALFALGWCSERALSGDTERVTAGGREAAQRIDALHRNAEVLVGMRMLGNAIAGWHGAHVALQRSQERLGSNAATLGALGRLLRQAVQVLMLGIGAWLVVAGNASPGIMIAATVLLARALQPVEHLIAGWKSLVEVRAAWQRLQQHGVGETGRAGQRLPAARGALSLERVVLAVEGQRVPLIKGVSLALQPGECLGLVGPSGSGKTTLLRLMLGLRRPSLGTVRLDGVELAHWPAEQLADAIGYLPQDVELFAGTVAQNIARLGEVDANRLHAAARLAGVHELVARLPQAYDTELGEAGAVLSGGQRQRIGLARALYGAPKLVLLDEPNAHLDAEGEAALAAALAALKQAGTTVVLVSHRPALMRHADTLVVLREGAIDVTGPRDQVLSRLAGATVHPLHRASTDSRRTAEGAQA
ncbi:MAG TPA: type I secretion system permease/ATPase [Rubrivivax sp.]